MTTLGVSIDDRALALAQDGRVLSVAPANAKLPSCRVVCQTVTTSASRPLSRRPARSIACLASSDPS